MLYVLTSLAAATLFGLGTMVVYGPHALVGNPWTEYVFWWLIGTGVVLQLVDGHLDLGCLWRRLSGGGETPCPTFSH